MMIDGVKGTVSRIEIGSVRPAWRVSPTTGDIHSDVIVEMTQQWTPADSSQSFRGGCTIVCDLDTGEVRYVIRKRVGHSGRTADQQSFRGALTDSTSQTAYFIGRATRAVRDDASRRLKEAAMAKKTTASGVHRRERNPEPQAVRRKRRRQRDGRPSACIASASATASW